MALRVFVSYSQRDDQVLALRLQTLATARPGVEVYVPPANTRSREGSPSPTELEQLKRADVVLAIISGVAVPPAMMKDLQLAHSFQKAIIPIAVQGRPALSGLVGQPVFHIDPLRPYETEQQILDYLERVGLGKSVHSALVPLLLLALGLIILEKK